MPTLGITPLIFATLLSSPQMSDGAARKQNEYPVWALRAEQSVASYQSVFVDPDGHVVRCDILAFKGSEKLAKYTCDQKCNIANNYRFGRIKSIKC